MSKLNEGVYWCARDLDVTNSKPEDDPYPWTGLGYTFDWGADAEPIAHAGLSEFLILDSKNLTTKNLVSPVASTEVYC